jgi:hypothetical protein
MIITSYVCIIDEALGIGYFAHFTNVNKLAVSTNRNRFVLKEEFEHLTKEIACRKFLTAIALISSLILRAIALGKIAPALYCI